MPDIMWIDFETYSEVDLKKCGVYRYVQSPTFKPLLLAYALGDEEFQVHEFNDSVDWPDAITAHVQAGGRFGSHSAFDFVILVRYFPLEASQHVNTVTSCAEYGIPQHLKDAGEFLGLPIGKDPVGHKAIHTFCIPKKVKGEFVRIYPNDEPELWEAFVQYCRVDGILMRMIYHAVPPVSDVEQALQEMDHEINKRGVRLDIESCQTLIGMVDQLKVRLNEVMAEITEGYIQTVGQVAKIAEYCGLPGAAEGVLRNALASGVLNDKQALVTTLRLTGSKSSVAKLPAMVQSADEAGISRGALQFHGTITGRWSGRQWQPHNLPRAAFSPDEVDLCVERARGPLNEFVDYYEHPMGAISMCLRGMVVPRDGHEFIISDYSQIEARMLAWYAGQSDILKIYEEGGDVYKEMASSVFKKPVANIDKSERFIGKTLVLGSGYALGWAGLQRNLANAGVSATDEEAKDYTTGFRQRFNHVVTWWSEITGTVQSIVEGTATLNQDGQVLVGRLAFGIEGDSVYVRLPTGKRQWFHGACMEEETAPWGDIVNVIKVRNPRGNGNTRYTLTPSILAENICSATSREILARAMHRLNHAGYAPVLSVHDEVVLEVPVGNGSDAEVAEIMCQRPPWGRHLPLAVELGRASRYGK